MKLFLTFLIGFLQLFIVVIPLNGKLADNRKPFLKKYTSRGKLLIACCILTLILTTIVFRISDAEEKEATQLLKQQLSYSDSLHRIQIKETGLTFVEALAKYGLKYDSSQKIIEKLVRDSLTHSVTNIISSEDPILEVCVPNGIKFIREEAKYFYYSLEICSNLASSSDINLNYTVLSSSELPPKQLYYISTDNVFESNGTLSSSYSVTIHFVSPKITSQNMIYLILKGTYKNYDKTKKYTIRRIYWHNRNNNTYGLLKGASADVVNTYLSENKIH